MGEGRDRLLKWYDFQEIPDPMVTNSVPIATVTLPPGPGMISPEFLIPVQIVLKEIRSNDRIALSATIVWNLGATTTPNAQVTVATQQMQFSIWRDAPVTGTRVGAVVDSGHLDEITFVGSVPLSTAVTTTFQITDTGVIGKTHSYFLTAAAFSPTGFFVPFTPNTSPQLITSFTNPTITEVSFNGSTIDENES